mmetsp:Transcript_42300/g.62213  ORF Transcript_42300/g.62213 Transcript_42300/m.62213 type:complete len:125 (-) Transcript_42300:245-619(-)
MYGKMQELLQQQQQAFKAEMQAMQQTLKTGLLQQNDSRNTAGHGQGVGVSNRHQQQQQPTMMAMHPQPQAAPMMMMQRQLLQQPMGMTTGQPTILPAMNGNLSPTALILGMMYLEKCMDGYGGL